MFEMCVARLRRLLRARTADDMNTVRRMIPDDGASYIGFHQNGLKGLLI